MNKKYVVTLTDEERRSLRGLVSSGKGAARKLTHARILLQGDSGQGGVGWTDERICEGLGVGVSTRFVEEGGGAGSETVCRRGLGSGVGSPPTGSGIPAETRW